jgi:hypothetical protein
MPNQITRSRSRPETIKAYHLPRQTTGSVMFIAIINSIYREFLKSSISGAKIASA